MITRQTQFWQVAFFYSKEFFESKKIKRRF